MTAMLEFRSLDLLSQMDGGEGIRLQIVRGFLVPPDVRGADYIVAAKAGRIPGNRIEDVLTVGLAGFVSAADPESWRDYTNDLLGVLAEGAGTSPGQLIARSPYLGLAAGVTATLTARVKNIIEGEVMNKRFQRWSVELEAMDPPSWVIGS